MQIMSRFFSFNLNVSIMALGCGGNITVTVESSRDAQKQIGSMAAESTEAPVPRL